jgi:6-phosphogluconolactonase
VSRQDDWRSDVTLGSSPRLTRRDVFPLFGAAAAAVALAPSLARAYAAQPAAAPANRYVYVGTYTAPHTAPGGTKPSLARGIYVFRMDGSTGALTQVQVAESENPSWVTLDAQGSHLYAVNEVGTWKGQANSGGVSAFSVNPSNGQLTYLNDQPTMGADSTHITVDPSGQWLVTANYTGGNFTLLPIQSTGQVGPLSDQFAPSGMGPNAARQEAPHAHETRFDPAGSFAFGADLGLDRLWSWRIDGGAGKFVANAVPYIEVASGSGSRHFDFHPSGKFLYVISELANSITVFSYDATHGTAIWEQTVTTLPADFTGTSGTAEIAVHQSGKWLYGTNRGHDSIVSFAIDQATGKLSSPGWVPTQGTVPRGMAIDPSGALLLVGNSDADTIVPFSINQSTGALVPTGAVTQTPVAVSFAFGAAIAGK